MGVEKVLGSFKPDGNIHGRAKFYKRIGFTCIPDAADLKDIKYIESKTDNEILHDIETTPNELAAEKLRAYRGRFVSFDEYAKNNII